MLPNKVFQLDYQDVAQMISKHIDYLVAYEIEKNIKFDLILAKLRNGAIAGCILANYFQISMGVIEMPRKVLPENFRVFFSSEVEEKLKNGHNINILFVDGICGTGTTLLELDKYFSTHEYTKQINLVTYCTLVDTNAKKKPDIIGLEVRDRFIQPPWEWRSFTPQAHLDRLEIGNVKASNEIEFCIGFSSQKVFQLVEEHFNKKIKFDWTVVFSGSDTNIKSASGVSTFNNISSKITLVEGKQKYKKLIEGKINFIENNGLTHFIEEDISQAILISQSCPVCHVIYIEENNLFRIFSKEVNKQDLRIS